MHKSIDSSDQRGEVYLREFRWEWSTLATRSLPEGTVDTVYLWLHDPLEGQNRMMVRLAPDVGELTAKRVEELARSPDERWVLIPGGSVVKLVPLSRDPAKVRVSVPGAPPRHFELPEGVALGEAGIMDILEALESRP